MITGSVKKQVVKVEKSHFVGISTIIEMSLTNQVRSREQTGKWRSYSLNTPPQEEHSCFLQIQYVQTLQAEEN